MTIQDALQSNRVPGETDWPSSYEDFAKLFWKVKGLQLEQRRQESFWSATNENLKGAYSTLEQQERKLQQAYSQIQRYLENIREGLLLIDRDFVIQGEYSSYLHDLFKTRDIAGRNLVDFLFPDRRAQEEERRELESFLDILFTSKNASLEMINDVNPLIGRELSVGEERLERRTIDASFTRIEGEDGVESVMFIFVDRTHEVEMERKLEREETRHESELETISAILKNGPEAFLDFIAESDKLIRSLKEKWNDISQPGLRTAFFKEVHSLKGVAKYFQLNHVSTLAHRLEGLISEASEGEVPDRSALYDTIEQLENDVEGIRALNDTLVRYAGSLAERPNGDATKHFFDSLAEMARKIAGEVNKQLEVRVDNRCGEIPFLSKLQSSIIHLVRNAVDHGIEDPYQRLSSKKAMNGTITIRVRLESGSYILDVVDDGAGIDFDAIDRKARELGLIKGDLAPTRARLVTLMFSPHFSSHDETTEISGRGLGLDIVRDAVRDLGGKVAVATLAGKGTRFTLTIPV